MTTKEHKSLKKKRLKVEDRDYHKDFYVIKEEDVKQAVKEFIEKNFYWEDGELQANWVEWYDWQYTFKEIFGFNDSEVKEE